MTDNIESRLEALDSEIKELKNHCSELFSQAGTQHLFNAQLLQKLDGMEEKQEREKCRKPE